MHKKSFLLSVLTVLPYVGLLILLSGCELTQNYLKHDRENNMEPQDYRDALAPRAESSEDDPRGRMNRASIPPLQDYVARPGDNTKAFPLVSISVNQTVPLRDVLFEIAEQAEYDIELDPRIRGSIIFSARNRPLDMVIDRIAEIAGLRYRFRDDMLRVEIDNPYLETYKVNYLALTRTNTSSISNDITVASQGNAAGNNDTSTGSSFTATNESVLDFWGELQTNLEQIISANRDSNRMATTRDTNPAPVEPLRMDEEGNLIEPPEQPQATLNVDTLPPDDEEGRDDDDEDPFEARFSLNRQAGLVSVFAPERLHKKIAEYMKDLKRSVTSQVLIEAKVLEVALNDEFSTGIDWSVAFGDSASIGFGPTAAGLVRGLLDTDGTIQSNAGLNIDRGDFEGAIDALSRFGTVQALSSPRLTVLNNQSAALNVVENVVYFEVDNEVVTGDGFATTTIDTDPRTVPEGVLINVQPAIDLDENTISMAVRPTITRITGFSNDPNPQLAAANVESPVPNVNVQEFDSVIQMNSGQAVVMGGLIQDRVSSTRNATPVLGEIPMFGALFRNQEDQVEKTELVVFLKATIIEKGHNVHATDKDLYRTFSSDRRPLRF